MESIGSYLKEVRESKQIPLKQASRETKILQEHLEQIENNEFHKIPGAMYIKGFLKTYGEYLGLNTGMLIQEYVKEFENSGKKKAKESLLPHYQRVELAVMTIEQWVPRLKKLILGLLIAGIIFAGIKFFPNIKAPFKRIFSFKAKQTSSVSQKETSGVLSDIEAIEKKSSAAVKEKTAANISQPGIAQDNTQANTTQANPGYINLAPVMNLHLEAKVLQNTWISLRIDGRLIFEGILEANEEEKWQGNELFEMQINQPQNILLFYNGQPVEEIKTYTTPKKLLIKDGNITIND